MPEVAALLSARLTANVRLGRKDERTMSNKSSIEMGLLYTSSSSRRVGSVARRCLAEQDHYWDAGH